MSKVAHYLQQHLMGEVLTSPDVIRYFSTDESIFEIRPLLVVHPRHENDVRKTARFCWQLAERGRTIPITIKGKGTDQTGASLGTGIVLTTPAHMNKIIELDPKSGIVSVESGAIVGKLQQTLHTHGRFLPSVGSSAEYSTVGGSVANNDAGSDSYKYGPLREHVRGMRVVLANGELIRAERLTKRELNKKLGYASFEGEIYRSLDKLIEESKNTIDTMAALGDRNNVGYDIADVKLKDGSFDLTPLFVGSQGTLGLISEVTFETQPHEPKKQLVVASFGSRSDAWSAIEKVNQMKDGPETADFIDGTLVKYIQQTNPSLYKGILDKASPEIVVFMEFAGDGGKKLAKKLSKMLQDYQVELEFPTQDERDKWYAARDSSSYFLNQADGRVRSVPLLDDAVIPVNKCAEFIGKVEALLGKYGQKQYAFWGQAGSGIIHTAPLYDVSQIGERQKMFKVLDEYYQLVAEMGGTIAGESAEGRLRGTQVDKVLNDDVRELMAKIKAIFDPTNILNPGVKVGVDLEALKPLVRGSYTLDHQHSHLPRR